jgi:hypothetical protein
MGAFLSIAESWPSKILIPNMLLAKYWSARELKQYFVKDQRLGAWAPKFIFEFAFTAMSRISWEEPLRRREFFLERRDFLLAEGGANSHGVVAGGIQHGASALGAGIPAASTASHLEATGAWRCGKQNPFPTSPHPRRRLRTKVKRGVTRTFHLVQKTGQARLLRMKFAMIGPVSAKTESNGNPSQSGGKRSFWQSLFGHSSPPVPVFRLDTTATAQSDLTQSTQRDEWIFLMELPSEKATWDVTYRGFHFAVSRDRVVRGFKLREVTELEYLASWEEHLGRRLRPGDELKLRQEYWQRNYRGRIFTHQLLIREACSAIDASGFLAEIWIGDLLDERLRTGERSTCDRQSGKWAIWGRFAPPDDQLQSRKVSSPPLMLEAHFMSANQMALLPDIKATRILECMPFIRSDGSHKCGSVNPEEIVEVIKILVLGGIRPAPLQHCHPSERVIPFAPDRIKVTPYKIACGHLRIKKAVDGMWSIDEKLSDPLP